MNLTTTEQATNNNTNEIEYNKTITYSYKINNIPYYLDVFFNKHNTLLNLSYTCDSDDLDFRIIRNLNNSKFIKKFIKLKTVNETMNDNIFHDIKNGFVYDYSNTNARLLFAESLNMNENTNYKKYPNTLNIRWYGLTDHKNEYAFVFIERCKYVSKQNCIKTRTAAIEIFSSDLNPDNIV